MTSVVSGLAINLFNQSPMKNCDNKRRILLLLFSRVLLVWGRGWGGGGLVVLDLFRTKDKIYAVLLLYRKFQGCH